MADVAAGFVTNSVAEKVVYGDKQEQANAILGQGGDEETSSGDGSPVKQKDFYWDQIALVLISAILGLSFLDISIEFFRGSELQCYFELDNFTISKGNYINSYCYKSLPSTQYYLVFILVSALVIIAPHYLWSAYFAAHFDFFFDLIKKLDRLRENCTGEYNPQNFARVKKLEEKFGKSRIFMFYKLKLVLQLCISIIALLINATYFMKKDFDEEFDCPRDCIPEDGNHTNQALPNCTEVWPLDGQFRCVYNSLRLLNFLHSTAFGLLGLTIVVLFIGLMWICSRHATELGAKKIADFCFNSCLHPEGFSFTPWKVLIFKCGGRKLKSTRARGRSRKSPNKCSTRGLMSWWSAIKKLALFNPRIENDLDFLLMRLFRADSGHGQVFKDIQIVKHLRIKTSVDHQRLYLLNKMHSDWLDQQLEKQQKAREEALRTGVKRPLLKRQSTLSPGAGWNRMKDIKSHFFESGFSAEGKNPELQVYSIIEDQLGARWKTKPSIRQVLYGFLNFAPNNSLAMDISFGTSTGFSLVLARAFYDVATVHFNRFYKNPKDICRVDKYQANYQTITLQDDIFSQTAKAITDSERPINKLFSTKEDGGLDLIVIGPLTSASMSDTTNLLIEKMYFKRYFTKRAVLLAVRPLWIGSHNRITLYRQFKPPKGLFQDMEKEVEPKLKASHVDLYHVKPGGEPRRISATTATSPSYTRRYHHARFKDELEGSSLAEEYDDEDEVNGEDEEDDDYVSLPAKGVLVECDDVECIFEFRLFRYIGKRFAPTESSLSEHSDTVPGDNEGKETSQPFSPLSPIPDNEIEASQQSLHQSPTPDNETEDSQQSLLQSSTPDNETDDSQQSLLRSPTPNNEVTPKTSAPKFNRAISMPAQPTIPPSVPLTLAQFPPTNEPPVSPPSADDNRNALMSPSYSSEGDLRYGVNLLPLP